MLDCQTKKGQGYIRHENWTSSWIESRAQGKTKLVEFDSLTSSADRFAISNSGLKQALIEIKARNMNKDTFVNRFKSEYMISEDKINRCRKISIEYKIPFFVFVNMIEDDFVLRIKVFNKDGDFVCPHRIENRRTQSTCNGGTKYDNVYLFQVAPHSIIPK